MNFSQPFHCLDNGGNGHETRLPLHITIADENDNEPEFTADIFTFRAMEEMTALTGPPIQVDIYVILL